MALSETSNLLVRISAQNETAKAFDEFKRGIDGIASTAVKAAAAVAGALAFRDVIDSTRRMGDEIDTLRDNFGLTARQASQLNFQARAMGSNAEEVSAAFGALNRKLFDQLPLLQKGESDFDKWGVSVTDAEGNVLPFDRVLENVSNRLRELPAGFARSGAAMDLLGRSGRQLIDLMTLNGHQIAELNAEAEEMGAILTDAGVDSIEDLNWKLNKMGVAFDVVKMQLGQAFIPVLQALVPILGRAAGAIKVLGEALRAPLGLVKEVIDRFGQFAEDIRKLGFGDAFAKLAEDAILKIGEIGTALDNLGPGGTLAKDALIALGGVLVLNALANTVAAIGGIASAMLKLPLRTVLLIDVVLVGLAFHEVMNNIDLIRNNWELLRRAQREGHLEQQGLLGTTLARLVQWGDMFSALGTAVQTTFSTIGRAISGAFQAVGAEIAQMVYDATVKLNQLILAINKVSPVKLPTIGGGSPAEGDPRSGPGANRDQRANPGNNRASPPATLDDVYANYEQRFGGTIDYEEARDILARGYTYRDLRAHFGLPVPLATSGIVRAPQPSRIGPSDAPSGRDRRSLAQTLAQLATSLAPAAPIPA